MGHATALFALSAGLTACSGIDAGIDYPNDLPSDLGPHLLTPEDGPNPSVGFVPHVKVAPDACKGIDVHPATQRLDQDDFSRFLEAQGVTMEPKQARANLYWYDFPNGHEAPNNFVRLRLAILNDSNGAAKDLHDALLRHGPGWWGVRRSNLAVLAPKASLHEALAFALKSKLVCWGIFTIAGNDDAYVIPSPYSEL